MSANLYNSDQVAVLASEILRHKKLYYQGSPEISDFEFDKLEEKLKTLSPKHPVLEMVGAQTPESSNPKVTHEKPMLSLDKTYSEEDLIEWVGDKKVVGTLKIDGTSMSLIYKSGKLELAKTRGNGQIGEDVTAKLNWVADALPNLPEKVDIEVRGELCCSESQFIHLCEEMVKLGLERPTSPRNIVAGVLGRKSSIELARFFTFYAFDLVGGKGFKDEIEKSTWLSSAGFKTPNIKLLKSPDEVKEYLDFAKLKMAEEEVGCDGVVFTYNDIKLQNELGYTSHHPKYKMSFKWQGQTAKSKIVNIEWSTSRFGVATPVAIIEPVELSGATITNITLHNASHVRMFNLKIGDTIELVRSGEVIPKFLSVVTSAKGEAKLPERCPSCNTRLESDDVRLRCPNSKNCPAQTIGGILNWIKAVGIEDLSDKRLQQMIDHNLIKSIPDLYKLKPSDLLVLPATKEKMADKIVTNIQKTKNVKLSLFLNGLGIEGSGINTWEKIVDMYPKLNLILNLTQPQLLEVDGIAERTSEQILNGLKDNLDLIQTLNSIGVNPIEKDPIDKGSQPFAGMTFVITGALSKPRKEIEDFIKNAGGKVSGSVSKATSVLITNEEDSGSTKSQKAKELGVKIWNEDELIANYK